MTKKKAVTWKEKELEEVRKVEAIPLGRAARLSASMFSKLIFGGSFRPVAQKSELQTRLYKFEVLAAGGREVEEQEPMDFDMDGLDIDAALFAEPEAQARRNPNHDLGKNPEGASSYIPPQPHPAFGRGCGEA